MSTQEQRQVWEFRLLAGVTAYTGFASISGGLGLLVDPTGKLVMLPPSDQLPGNPFPSYFIPAMLLLFVGAAGLLGGWAVWKRWANSALYAGASGCITMGYIAGQVMLLGYRNWLQPGFFLLGVAVTVLAERHRRREAAQRQGAVAPGR
jgi:hypothetical protein